MRCWDVLSNLNLGVPILDNRCCVMGFVTEETERGKTKGFVHLKLFQINELCVLLNWPRALVYNWLLCKAFCAHNGCINARSIRALCMCVFFRRCVLVPTLRGLKQLNAAFNRLMSRVLFSSCSLPCSLHFCHRLFVMLCGSFKKTKSGNVEYNRI